MLFDSEKYPAGFEFRADVIVVGAGAAGIPAAIELEAFGLDVLVLETGELKPSKRANALSAGTVTDSRHGPLDRYRERTFGGTTRVWGGRVAPFDEIDFARRDFVTPRGWPFGLAELQPFYRRAHEYLEAGDYNYDAESSHLRPTRPVQNAVDFSSASFHHRMLWRFSRPTDLGKAWKHHFEQSNTVRVALNLTCVELVMSEDGSTVVACELRSISGKQMRATAAVILLTGGGLEVTRLLLSSGGTHHPKGLGNHSDHLGRYYSSHLTGDLGSFEWTGPRRLAGLHYERDPEGVYVRRSLSLRPETQMESDLLNFRAIVAPPAISDPSHGSAVLSAGYLAKRYFLRRIPPEYDARYGRTEGPELRRRHMRNVLANAPELIGFAPWWLTKRIIPARKVPSMEVNSKGPTFFLHFDAEQTPLRESRISLTEHRDELGMRRLLVDWRFRDSDIEALSRAYSLLASELDRAGLARPLQNVNTFADRVTSHLGVGSHHIGTTRMSASPRDGVTDPEGRVHGVSNLFLASSSLFPSTGVANPTLTIVALAVRASRAIGSYLGRA